jgi:hypothetical protein
MRVETPSNVEKNWKLEIEFTEAAEEWGRLYTVEGETHPFFPTNSYDFKLYYTPSDKERVFKGRARFLNSDGVAGSWSDAVLCVVPFNEPSAPSMPSTLTVEGVTTGDYKHIHLECSEVTGATKYEWRITRGTNYDVKLEATTSEPEVFISVSAFHYLYNYAGVRAVNNGGESTWKVVSTGW